jgi:tetratricopeptide (TPR) repeat protein
MTYNSEFYIMSNRLELLQQFYNEDPHDPFNIYGLALEYLKTDLLKSRELFEKLLTSHREYIPTYYHAAKLYAELDDRDRAISVYRDGIEQAKRLQDQKALRELQSAYNELVFE